MIATIARIRTCLPLLLLPCLVLLGLAGTLDAAGDCLVGNLNEPVGPPAPDIFQGHESYAYLVYPPDNCLCEQGGFTVQTITQVLYFDATQVPVTLQVQASLRLGVLDIGGTCWLPGPQVCLGPVIPVTITSPGFHWVTAPLPGCPMQPFGNHYFLSLQYLGGGPGFLAIDDAPQACTEYVERGLGWEDMFTFPAKTGGGKAIIFGDVLCGAMSVENQTGSWGSIKSLYR